ncbi:MAG: aminotransferase class I/II-fold pyridoxal phosphate-dependent enzyme [Cryobacterium sp.]|nr:aminotransferase class I/II-fold pyridoxal phosphate-dependent enzyme [Cryobacterium sp.]
MSAPDVGELEEQYLVAAIRSGWVAPLGPDVTAFEEEMAARCEVRHAVSLSSGTAALHLALLSSGVGPDDLVVTATMTFAATANAIVYTGARPFFVDCELATGNMDPRLLREALVELTSTGQRVAAIVPVDLLGKCANYTEISEIAREFDIPLVVDAAESLGATHRGQPAGSFGHASILSFNGNKVMTTSGGGMLLTNDAAVAERARHLATQAREPVDHYEHREIGFNYRMSNLLAAVGRAQLARLDAMLTRRRAIREMYAALVDSVEGVSVFGRDGDVEDNCWLTSVVVEPSHAPSTAARVRAALNDENIESRPLWKPMHLQPAFSGASALINGSAESLFASGLTLPSGSALTDAQLDRVVTALSTVLGQSR